MEICRLIIKTDLASNSKRLSEHPNKDQAKFNRCDRDSVRSDKSQQARFSARASILQYSTVVKSILLIPLRSS